MAIISLVTFALYALASAAPAPELTPAPVHPVAARAAAISNESQLSSALSALSSGPASSFAAGYTNLLSAIQPLATPSNAQQASSRLAAAYSARPSNVLGIAADILLSGLTGASGIGSFASDLEDFGACNGYSNVNLRQPNQPVYPQKAPNDAPYDVSEATLRAAIYFPPSFTYGQVQPAIFIPGTGVEACEDFAPNLGKLFTGSSYADPVYVNVPNNMLMDAQTNAEYVAYAINYIASITNRNVSVLTWSQGGIATQWALKYWPSTRNVTSDFIAVSPDYHGTVLAPILCPPGVPCAPSVLQQNYNSNFIQTLRSNGGDSAYVPTTEIHSIFDEIVEPQQDPFPGASAHINDARSVGATNVQIQDICPPGSPAGGPNFGHESSLYNAVTFVVARDALTNPGPANIQRSGASSQCPNFEATGLTLTDLFATEALIPLAGFNIEAYPNKVVTEPPIKPYAAS